MFKLAIFIRADGLTIDPFACKHLRSYLRNGIVITTKKMFELSDGFKAAVNNGIKITQLIVIGQEASIINSGINENGNAVFVKDIKSCIRYLSQNHSSREWWVIGDNQFAYDLIMKGLIMDVHISKSRGSFRSFSWNEYEPYTIHQEELFNKSILERSEMEFSMISQTDIYENKTIKHFMRRNREECNLLTAMNEIITHGFKRPNRTGVSTRSLFGKQFEYRMTERIDPVTGRSSFRLPLLTTKKMFVRGVFGELKWFLNGSTDSKILESDGINIWKGNSSRQFLDTNDKKGYAEGECGPIYGFQWRHWNAEWKANKTDYTGEGIDQVAQVVKSLQEDPYSRRHIISGWNVKDLDQMVLPPCHVLYQFLVHETDNQKYLTLMMTQRSCDVFLGLPFNICSLGLFLLMMSHRVGMKPYKIIHSISDFHLYETHIEQASIQTTREPCMFPYVQLNCDPKENLEDYEFKDIVISDYYSHDRITADMVA